VVSTVLVEGEVLTNVTPSEEREIDAPSVRAS
jgi:hypothetical protein